MTETNNDNPVTDAVTEESGADESTEELVRGTFGKAATTTDIKDLDRDNIKNTVFIASIKQSVIASMLEVISKMPEKDVEERLSKDQITAISVNMETQTKTTIDDAKADKINTEEFVNEISYEGTNLGIVPAKIKPKGRLKSGNGVAAFTTRLGIGKYVTARLWHSGFSVIISPPKDSEIIALHYSISNLEEDLATDTCNYIYSNYSVVINKLVLEFILDHVAKCTLILPEDKRLIDYIKITDLETLTVAMASAMYPSGSDITVTCKNSNIIKDSLPVCDFTATATIDPSKLVWVNKKILDTISLVHMAKTNPKSHTVESVLAYQNALKVNAKFEHTIGEGDSSFVIELQTPTLATYFDSGEYWVNAVITATQDIVGSGDSEDIKERKVSAMTMASVLNKYNSYITKITIDEAYVDELDAVSDILSSISSDGVITDAVIKHISDHINGNYVSVVATYDYDCPKCLAAGRDAKQAPDLIIEGFKGFTPLNAVEHFLDLSTLRFTRIVNRKK